jgi:hypothetical protein
LRNTKVLGSDCDLSRARKRQGGIFRWEKDQSENRHRR